MYNTAEFFWEDLKFLKDEKPNKNLRVLILSMYDDHPSLHPHTPIDFHDDSLGLDDLRLTEIEFYQVVANFVDYTSHHEDFVIHFPDNILEIIQNITAGHPGIVMIILSLLKNRYRQDPNNPQIISTTDYLVSSKFLFDIEGSRIFSWLIEYMVTWIPTADEMAFLRVAVCNATKSSFCVNFTQPSFKSIVSKFERSGLITKVTAKDVDSVHGASDASSSSHVTSVTTRAATHAAALAAPPNKQEFQFAAPLVRIILGRYIFQSKLSLKRSKGSFDEFLRLSIVRMRPSILRESLSCGENGILYERMWRMEWFRAASTAVPDGMSISADVGPVFGSDELLDFYINGDLKWGVELLREGNNMKEHSDRFKGNGEYKNIPLNHWVIIDFHKTKRLDKPSPNFWHVLYTNVYDKVTVKRLHLPDLTLNLIGDNLSTDWDLKGILN